MLRVYLVSPGGNLTAVVSSATSIEPEAAQDLLALTGAEQVGLTAGALLQMAGGELSLNGVLATAIVAWHLVHRTEFTFSLGDGSELEVSLDPTATPPTVAMPGVRSEVVVVDRDRVEVHLPGISHIVTRGDGAHLSREALESYAGDRGLPAVGHVRSHARGVEVQIDPLVFVAEVGSCVREEACGSGALAAALAWQRWGSDESSTTRIRQPSGCTSVITFSEDELTYGIELIAPLIGAPLPAEVDRGLAIALMIVEVPATDPCP